MNINGIIENKQLKLSFKPENPPVNVDIYKNRIVGCFMNILGKAVKLNVTTASNVNKTFYVKKDKLRVIAIKTLVADPANVDKIVKKLDKIIFKILLLLSKEQGQGKRSNPIFPSINFAALNEQMKRWIHQIEEGATNPKLETEATQTEVQTLKEELEKVKKEAQAAKESAEKAKESTDAEILKLKAGLISAKVGAKTLKVKPASGTLVAAHAKDLDDKITALPAITETPAKPVTKPGTLTKMLTKLHIGSGEKATPDSTTSPDKTVSPPVPKVDIKALREGFNKGDFFKKKSQKILTAEGIGSKDGKVAEEVARKADEESGHVGAEPYFKAISRSIVSKWHMWGHKSVDEKALKLWKNPSKSGAQPNTIEQPLTPEEIEKNEALVKKTEELAAQGDPQEQCVLALMYKKGVGKNKDISKAVELYKKAAEQGHPSAAYKIARWYKTGKRLEKNPEEAFRFYKIAADKEHVSAQYMVGECFEKGRGVKQDIEEAKKYYSMAIIEDDSDAAFRASYLSFKDSVDAGELKDYAVICEGTVNDEDVLDDNRREAYHELLRIRSSLPDDSGIDWDAITKTYNDDLAADDETAQKQPVETMPLREFTC